MKEHLEECRGHHGLSCPSCGGAVRHQFDLAHGTHVDYHCACGQRLQWDHPLKAIAKAAFLVGAPHPCAHAALCVPEALFPHAGPGTMEWSTERTEEPSAWMSGARREAEEVVSR
jgi:hypothetical protein